MEKISLFTRLDFVVVKFVHRIFLSLEKRYKFNLKELTILLVGAMSFYHLIKSYQVSMFDTILTLFYLVLAIEVLSGIRLFDLRIYAQDFRKLIYKLLLLALISYFYSALYFEIRGGQTQFATMDLYLYVPPLVIAILVTSKLFSIITLLFTLLCLSCIKNEATTTEKS